VVRNGSEFSVHERVNHHIYGLGTISMTDDSHTIIDFDQNGRKKFVTSMVRLEHSDTAAPQRAKPRTKKSKATT
jgi:hypothetical protein